jgi:hypothetical protein
MTLCCNDILVGVRVRLNHSTCPWWHGFAKASPSGPDADVVMVCRLANGGSWMTIPGKGCLARAS